MLNPIVMCYRPSINHPHYRIDRAWRSMTVSEENSEVTDGMYDIVLTYIGQSTLFSENFWEVVTFQLPR